MGKPTGFIEWARQTPRKRDKAIRVRDWGEFIPPFEAGVLTEQAGRCIDCGVPFCMQGCPLGNQIPDWNDLVYRDRFHAAWVALESTNNLPEVTGRICPAPCEAACVLSINQEPVTIELIEREIAERAFAEGWVKPEPPRVRTGKTVAVVGSGPAGLAAAQQLNRAGHLVTVYEKADRVGGLLRYGIPDFKLEKWIIDRRLEVIAAEGVRFETGVDVGGGVSFAELKVRHDALVLAIGAESARELDVPGRELAGVHLAMDYLTQQNKVNAGDALSEARIDAAGKRVVILGGGDTGADCLGTAHRQEAASVTQLELLPAPPERRTADNPWPQWPMIFRTAASHEEGGERLYALMTKKLTGKDGRLQALHVVRAGLERDEESGRNRIVEVPGSELTLPCDLLLLAMGFVGPVAARAHEQLGVALGARGIQVDRDFKTSVEGVYCAGDASRGASLIVWAISDGREAARSVDAYLRGAPSRLPTRGAHQPFGGR